MSSKGKLKFTFKSDKINFKKLAQLKKFINIS